MHKFIKLIHRLWKLMYRYIKKKIIFHPNKSVDLSILEIFKLITVISFLNHFKWYMPMIWLLNGLAESVTALVCGLSSSKGIS